MTAELRSQRAFQAHRLDTIGPGGGARWTWASDLTLFRGIRAGKSLRSIAAELEYSEARCLSRLKKLLPEVCCRDALDALDDELSERAEREVKEQAS